MKTKHLISVTDKQYHMLHTANLFHKAFLNLIVTWLQVEETIGHATIFLFQNFVKTQHVAKRQ